MVQFWWEVLSYYLGIPGCLTTWQMALHSRKKSRECLMRRNHMAGNKANGLIYPSNCDICLSGAQIFTFAVMICLTAWQNHSLIVTNSGNSDMLQQLTPAGRKPSFSRRKEHSFSYSYLLSSVWMCYLFN